MSRVVRIVFLALTLVLCHFAGHAPVAADTLISHLCGPDSPNCQIDQDCDAYCQPCGRPGLCVSLLRSGESKACFCR